jgi:hypothetical protein
MRLRKLSAAEDAGLMARARAATLLLQRGHVQIDGVELLAAVVWPESDTLQRLGEALEGGMQIAADG